MADERRDWYNDPSVRERREQAAYEILSWAWNNIAIMDSPGPVDPQQARDEYRKIAEAYQGRPYHNLNNTLNVYFEVFREETSPNLNALRFAAIFHDVVYDTRAQDNEEKSAQYCQEVLTRLGIPSDVTEEATRLIRATATHVATPDDINASLLMDADLKILGSFPEIYDSYASAIREEYSWVSEEQYREERARILQGFLDRPNIYASSRFRERYEARARENITREIERLNSGE